jgi:hypothetical protein
MPLSIALHAAAADAQAELPLHATTTRTSGMSLGCRAYSAVNILSGWSWKMVRLLPHLIENVVVLCAHPFAHKSVFHAFQGPGNILGWGCSDAAGFSRGNQSWTGWTRRKVGTRLGKARHPLIGPKEFADRLNFRLVDPTPTEKRAHRVCWKGAET